jgi:hypothetical protein
VCVGVKAKCHYLWGDIGLRVKVVADEIFGCSLLTALVGQREGYQVRAHMHIDELVIRP